MLNPHWTDQLCPTRRPSFILRQPVRAVRALQVARHSYALAALWAGCHDVEPDGLWPSPLLRSWMYQWLITCYNPFNWNIYIYIIYICILKYFI